MDTRRNYIEKNDSGGKFYQTLLLFLVLVLLFAFFQGLLLKNRWPDAIGFPFDITVISIGSLFLLWLVVLKVSEGRGGDRKIKSRKLAGEHKQISDIAILNRVLESTQDVFWSFDLTGESESYVSLSAEAKYGKPIAKLKKLPYFWLDDIYTEDAGIKQDVHEQLAKKGAASFSCRVVDGKNEIRWISVHVRMFRDAKGNNIRLEGTSTEVTYIKQAERIIERQEFQLRALFENLDMALTIVEKDGTILMFNKLAEELCRDVRRPLEEGRNIFDLAAPQNKLTMRQLFQNVMCSKSTETYVTSHPDRDGVQQYFSTYYIPVFDATHEVQQICIMSRDITAQKVADEKLNNERKLLRTLIDNIPDFVYVKDRSLKHIVNNRANVNLIGAASEAETLGKTVMDYFPKSVATSFLNVDRKIIETGVPVINHEEEIVDRNGKKHWMLTTKIPVKDESDEISYLVGISRDITDRKNMELALRLGNQRFAMACRATDDTIWDRDLINDDAYLGDNFTELFGHVWGNTRVNSDQWAQYIHPDDVDRVRSSLQTFIESSLSGARWHAEYRYFCRDGSVAYVFDRGYLIFDESGKPVRMVGAMQNVTEITEYRRSLEQKVQERTNELNKALAKEKEIVDMKSRFVSIASHEFRTPLSSISAICGVLRKHQDKITPFEIDEKLLNIDKQVHHMTCMLDDVLMVEKADAGKYHVVKKEIHVRPFLTSLSEEVAKSRGNSHEVSLKIDTSVERIASDEKLLRSVIINLLTNAIKFSPGAEHVDLSISSEQKYLVINVKDYGIGIASDDIKNLTEPFYRGKNASTIQGTGLGLSIIKKALDLLSGSMSIASEIGNGTEVIVKLPLTL